MFRSCSVAEGLSCGSFLQPIKWPCCMECSRLAEAGEKWRIYT